MSTPTDGHGLYEQVNPDGGQSVWGPRLDQMAAGGFKLALNYSAISGSMANLIAYINYAASKGMKVIVDLHASAIWEGNGIASNFASIYASAGSPAYYCDGFFSNTSANFTQSHNDGGSNGTWTWDTANTRVTQTTGAEPVLIYSSATLTDGFVETVMTNSSSAGLAIRWTNGNNTYTCYLFDSAQGGNANFWQIQKIVAGSYTILTQGTFSTAWTAGTAQRFRFQAVGTTISLYRNGALVGSATDSALASGKAGFIGGGGTTYFYGLNLSAYPDFATYVINQTKNLSGTWGYYLADEPALNEQYLMALHADNVKLATTLPRLIVLTSTTTNNSFSATTPYTASCDVGADDTYPLDGFSRIPVADTAYNNQALCTSTGISSGIVLQAFSLSMYAGNGTGHDATTGWPPAASIATWRQAAETIMSPRLILWYSYHDIVSAPTNAAQHWSDLVNALSLNPDNGSAFNDAALATNPIRHYALDDLAADITNGLACHDMSVYRQAANYYGSAIVGKPSILPSRVGRSILFNGNSITVNVPTNGMPTGAGAFSASIGFLVGSLPDGSTYWGLMGWGDTGADEFLLYLNNAKVSTQVGGHSIASSTLTAGVAYYVTATYDGTTLRLYLNGTLQTSVATTASIHYTTDYVRIGGFGQNSQPGYSQMATLHGVALSAQQVAALAAVWLRAGLTQNIGNGRLARIG